ncbi:MAG: DNA repair protein RecN [Firmicutes bacterium]|jgi:DNA repair protein RecN (Recombination protein N)|nr:DNA repair protein RecN [Bacillota bacterium]
MLSRLRIRDFALVDSLEIEFGSGLNVLTGETGAGKSIIIDAVEMLLGGRASADCVRSGRESASVEGVFSVRDNASAREYVASLGIEPADELVLSREISASGRSVARVNGKAATAGVLRELGGRLVDIHGQHEHQSLLRPETHVEVLDAFGGAAVGALRTRVAGLYRDLRAADAEFRGILKGERDRARRLDILRYQHREIGSVSPRPGEDLELAEEAEVLRNAERLKQRALAAYALLYEGGETSATDILGSASAEVAGAAAFDPVLSPLAEAINEASEVIKEAARDLRSYAERLETNVGRLAAVEARMDAIQQLKSKYGDTIEEILRFQDECAAEIERLENSEGLAESLEKRRAALSASLGEACAELSRERRRIAPTLQSRVNAELEALGMGACAFVVGISTEEDDEGVLVEGRRLAFGPNGVDRVEFLIAPNPGEPPKPLGRIASGGEMSRVMLALKSVIADVDMLPCLIFDEIDAGIGGSTAKAVGERLAMIGRRRQVLCVTHLANIACRAGTHILIWKETDGRSTRTLARAIAGPERTREIARMLGGSSETALRHATELLGGAH